MNLRCGGDRVANDLVAKVAYLQGLAKGLGIPKDSKENKLIKEIINIMQDFAEEVRELQETQEQLKEYIEALDDALCDLEVSDSYVCDFVEVECPNCGELVLFEPEILEEDAEVEIICPECDEVMFVTEGESKQSEDDEHENELDAEESNEAEDSQKIKVD
ncbi:AraC family transcriptional regulator [Peptococcaceae bacterium]|nr:AraC family transcriptional regulator [Peptococcaceae bacterium]